MSSFMFSMYLNMIICYYTYALLKREPSIVVADVYTKIGTKKTKYNHKPYSVQTDSIHNCGSSKLPQKIDPLSSHKRPSVE